MYLIITVIFALGLTASLALAHCGFESIPIALLLSVFWPVVVPIAAVALVLLGVYSLFSGNKVQWDMVFTPSAWCSLKPTCMEVDKLVNLFLEGDYSFEPGFCTTKVIHGGKVVTTLWTSNYPYCYGHLYHDSLSGGLPRVSTRKKLYERIKQVPLSKYYNV